MAAPARVIFSDPMELKPPTLWEEFVMPIALTNEIAKLAAVDLFKRSKTGGIETGIFVARPFYLDYDRAHLLVADAWKQKARGIPQGAFLLGYYENEDGVAEVRLLRALRPTKSVR
jgi:hypothetical protein